MANPCSFALSAYAFGQAVTSAEKRLEHMVTDAAGLDEKPPSRAKSLASDAHFKFVLYNGPVEKM